MTVQGTPKLTAAGDAICGLNNVNCHPDKIIDGEFWFYTEDFFGLEAAHSDLKPWLQLDLLEARKVVQVNRFRSCSGHFITMGHMPTSGATIFKSRASS